MAGVLVWMVVNICRALARALCLVCPIYLLAGLKATQVPFAELCVVMVLQVAFVDALTSCIAYTCQDESKSLGICGPILAISKQLKLPTETFIARR